MMKIRLFYCLLVSLSQVQASMATTPEPELETTSPSPDCDTDFLDDDEVSLTLRWYNPFVIEIADTVPEDHELLENLQHLMEIASQTLGKATKEHMGETPRGLAFSGVTFSLPSSWSNPRDIEEKKKIPKTKPLVIVDHPNPRHGVVPYTMQPGGCGERGLYIHLTPIYIRNMEKKDYEKRFGKADRVFVHEWAHLRWGVFDEYVTMDGKDFGGKGPIEKPFYFDSSNNLKPSVCPKETLGWILKEETKQTTTNSSDSVINGTVDATTNYKLCLSSSDNGLPPDECGFVPDPNQHTNTSIMASNVLQKSEFFCGGKNVAHNAEAPTAQNIQCGGRSVASVMNDHADFNKNWTQMFEDEKTSGSMDTSADPKFQFFRRQKQSSLIFLIECSKKNRDNLQHILSDIARYLEYFSPPKLRTFVMGTDPTKTNSETTSNARSVLSSVSCYERNSNDQTPISHIFNHLPENVTTLGNRVTLIVLATSGRTLEEIVKVDNQEVDCKLIALDCPIMDDSNSVSCQQQNLFEDDLCDVIQQEFSKKIPAADKLKMTYTEDHSMELEHRRQQGTPFMIKGNMFVNYCTGSTVFVVQSSIEFALFLNEATSGESAHYVVQNKSGDTTAGFTVVTTIPCSHSGAQFNYEIRFGPAASPPTNQRKTVVKLYQNLDEHMTGRVRSHVIIKKLKSKECGQKVQKTENNVRKRRAADDGATTSVKVPYGTTQKLVVEFYEGDQGYKPVVGAIVKAKIKYINNPRQAPFTVLLSDFGYAADSVAGDGIYTGYITGVKGDGQYQISIEASQDSSEYQVVDTGSHQANTGSNTNNFTIEVICREGTEVTNLPLSLVINDTQTEPLTTLHADIQGRKYSGNAIVPSSGTLSVPPGCVVRDAERVSEQAIKSIGSSGSSVQDQVFRPDLKNLPPSSSDFQYLGNSTDNIISTKLPKDVEHMDQDQEPFELKVEPLKFKFSEQLSVIQVYDYSPYDIFPPARVLDLNVTRLYYNDVIGIALQWTSSGDDMFSGTASAVELHYHEEKRALLQQFSRTHRVHADKLVRQGSLDPLPGESLQRIVVKFPEYALKDIKQDRTIYFGMNVRDEEDNESGVSNIATARFTVKETVKAINIKNSDSSMTNIAVIMMCVLFALVFSVVVIIRCVYKFKQKEHKDSLTSDINTTSTTMYNTYPRDKK